MESSVLTLLLTPLEATSSFKSETHGEKIPSLAHGVMLTQSTGPLLIKLRFHMWTRMTECSSCQLQTTWTTTLEPLLDTSLTPMWTTTSKWPTRIWVTTLTRHTLSLSPNHSDRLGLELTSTTQECSPLMETAQTPTPTESFMSTLLMVLILLLSGLLLTKSSTSTRLHLLLLGSTPFRLLHGGLLELMLLISLWECTQVLLFPWLDHRDNRDLITMLCLIKTILWLLLLKSQLLLIEVKLKVHQFKLLPLRHIYSKNWTNNNKTQLETMSGNHMLFMRHRSHQPFQTLTTMIPS